MAPEYSLEVPEGLGSGPEVSGMSRNGPGMSRKVLEASRRFRKDPEVYGQYHPHPHALAWWAIHPGRPKGWGRTKQGESYSRWEFKLPIRQVFGGKVWEALEGLGVQIGLPNLLELRPKPLGPLYKVSQRGGERPTKP